MSKESPLPRLVRCATPISRRRFLALGAASAAGAAILGPRSLAAADSHFDLLSVGYVEGSEDFGSLRRLPWPLMQRSRPTVALKGSATVGMELDLPQSLDVVPAEEMLMGDPELSFGTVWMRVHGLHPAFDAATARLFDAAYLTVLFPTDDPHLGDYEIAVPWGARGGSRPTAGMPVRFQVPLRVDGGLELVIDVGRPGLPSERYATAFTVDPVAGLPKIQRGVYLLGLGADTWNRSRSLDSGGMVRTDDLSLVVSFEPVEDPEES